MLSALLLLHPILHDHRRHLALVHSLKVIPTKEKIQKFMMMADDISLIDK
jgi:hypothetical protein